MNSPVKKLFILGLVLTLLLITAAPVTGATNKVRVFVQFSPNGKTVVQSAINQAGGTFHYTFDDLSAFAVSVPAGAIRGLYRNPNVVRIVEDSPRYPILSAPSTDTLAEMADTVDPNGQDIPYGIDAVQAREVWDFDRDGNFDSGAPTGSGVTVCIIDTGFYSAHEDLSGIPLTGGIAQLDPPYTNDGFGHGSHVAGTIAAQNNGLGVVGVSPGVSFYIVKYFGDDGAAQLFASDLIAGTNACANNGSKIISMSLGGTLNNYFENIQFNNLYSAGILSIAAAGNAGDTSFAYPASYGSVVSVGAVDEANNVASFSQQNNQVELAAPGVSVLSTLPFIDNTTVTFEGTTYQANLLANSTRNSASGQLADGGICDTTNTTGEWNGKVVLCQRGAITFYEKTMNVQNSGGVAAVVYNNSPGSFLGTLGEDTPPVIIAITLSQADGLALLSNVGSESLAFVDSEFLKPASGYGKWNGTSMATPHVSAVAALLWSADPSATNTEIRNAMTATALDLGSAGRDNAYGFGLVQAKDALDYMGGVTPPPPPPPPGDNSPSVSISNPADGQVLPMCTDSEFIATASDLEDGNLDEDIIWTSDQDGQFGTGHTVFATLSGGDHSITATVTDSNSLTGTDTITVYLRNADPELIYFSPANGAIYAHDELIFFNATALDADYNPIDISSSIIWTAGQDQIGTGGSFSRTLPDGEHQITASITDYCDVTSAVTVTITVLPPPNAPPTLTITSPADGASFDENDTITFTGTANDPEDGDKSASISWSSNLDGGLGTGASLSTTLSKGSHTITASVTDSGGLSFSESITVTVTDPILVVTVDTDKDVYTNRDKVKITVDVSDGSLAIANANITVTITSPLGRQKIFTGTTDANGNFLINYKFNTRKDGKGEYTVYASATLPGYEGGSDSTSFTVE